MENQLFRATHWSSGALGVIVAGAQLRHCYLAHDDAEPLLPIGQDVELALVGSTGQVLGLRPAGREKRGKWLSAPPSVDRDAVFVVHPQARRVTHRPLASARESDPT